MGTNHLPDLIPAPAQVKTGLASAMDRTSTIPLDAQLAAANEWWRLAGVDLVFEDEPRPWLADETEVDEPDTQRAAKRARPSAPREAPPARIGGDAAAWPRDCAAFREWCLAEPTIDIAGMGPRAAPVGEPGAALMIMVPMPEVEDREHLLSGAQGKLIANMAAAMGIGGEALYLASALPGHLDHPDWAALAQRGLGAVVQHHIAIARPARLLVLGRRILPLLEHDLAQGPAAIKKTSIQTPSGSLEVPTLADFAPERLLHNAGQRAALWRRWLDWTDAD